MGFLRSIARLSMASATVACSVPPPPVPTSPEAAGPADRSRPSVESVPAPIDGAPAWAGDPTVDEVPPWQEVFHPPHGVQTAPLSLTLTNPLGHGELRYTLDASSPAAPEAMVYTDSIPISASTVVRAAVVDPDTGDLLFDAGAQTYLFLDQVKDQTPPGDWPTEWWTDDADGPYVADYTIDPDVVDGAEAHTTLIDSLSALPIVAITLPTEDLFGETGIYEHPKDDGAEWERVGWVEWLEPDGASETTQQVGFRIHGGAGRRPDRSPKKSFRLLGKKSLSGDLEFPVYPGEAVEAFDTLVFRAGYNRTWVHYQESQRSRAMYTRESFATGLHRDMGHLSVHVRHAHLFLDGLYWGVYQIQERPDAKFHASWLGGDADDYDALNSGVVTDGEDSAWLELFDRARLDLTDDAHYRSVEALLELDAFIDYMVLNQYLGNRDWPVKNYWVARNRAEDGPFHFRVWDAELIQSVSTDNIIDVTAEGSPGELFQALRTHPEFRLRVADRVQAHFFHGGALSEDAVQARWATASTSAFPGMEAESARWGDHWRDDRDNGGELYRVDPHWHEEDAYVTDFWIPRRGAIYLAQLADADLWPSVAAAEVHPPGGEVPSGAAITVTIASGEAWCTTDGTDPRDWGGEVASTATRCPTELAFTADTTLKVRVLDADTWSPVVALDFTMAP